MHLTTEGTAAVFFFVFNFFPDVPGLKIRFSFCCEHFGLCCESFAFAVNFLICTVNILVCAVSYLLLL